MAWHAVIGATVLAYEETYERQELRRGFRKGFSVNAENQGLDWK